MGFQILEAVVVVVLMDTIANGSCGGAGGSGIVIIRHKYYDPDDNNPNKVVLQQNGHLYPYSFVWKGLANFHMMMHIFDFKSKQFTY